MRYRSRSDCARGAFRMRPDNAATDARRMRASPISALIAASAFVFGVACNAAADAPPPSNVIPHEPTGAAADAAAPSDVIPHEPTGAATTAPLSEAATEVSGDGFGGATVGEPPSIGMPFAIEELLDEAINPFGVVRWSHDRALFGHSGIDLSLRFGAELVAVGGGEVVAIKPSPDPRPGLEIVLLLDDGAQARAGEGWAFIYEHVDLLDGIAAGTRVVRGQPLGVSPLRPEIGNHHLQITYIFTGYEFSRDHRCWLDQLTPDDRAGLELAITRIGATAALRASWFNDEREGGFPFRGLLDEDQFPEGPRFCYAPGTDVR